MRNKCAKNTSRIIIIIKIRKYPLEKQEFGRVTSKLKIASLPLVKPAIFYFAIFLLIKLCFCVRFRLPAEHLLFLYAFCSMFRLRKLQKLLRICWEICRDLVSSDVMPGTYWRSYRTGDRISLITGPETCSNK